MKLNQLAFRRFILVIITLVVFGIFVAQLMNIQIVQADEIRRNLEAGTISRQTVKATRGEIVDRNGLSMVSNRLGYDVVINKAFFPKESQNDVILKLVGLFQQNNTEWIDNLPISFEEPFAFIGGYDKQVASLKKRLEIQEYATEEDAMSRLVERYGLESYSPADARKIAGVRYEMEQRGFAINVPYTFADDIDIDLVLQIKERGHILLGVDVAESALRSFDMGDIAPHIIGRTGPIYAEDWPTLKEKGYAMDDKVGKSGVESAFEDELRGENGERVITQDASGKVVDDPVSKPPVPGNTIVLTLDSRLQSIAQRALATQIKNLQESALPGKGKEADVGAVVAIHVKTGQILACATYPSYDQRTFLEDYDSLNADTQFKPLINRALTGLYAPGSTFKPVVATAALNQGLITEQTNVNCNMVYTRFTDYQPKCLSAHGAIGLNRALSLSCNIFFYDIGWNVGIGGIDTTAKQYGLGEPTGIELFEETGQRSNPETQLSTTGEKWNNGDVLQSAIGQLVQRYTPLQLANYAATIANRGARMKVTIVKEIQDYSREKVVNPSKATVLDRIDVSPDNLEAIIRGMVAASRTGSTAAHFASYPFDVASKTGTPESSDLPNSTLICFGPAQDPEIAIAVVIEKGWHGYTGAPVAKAIMDEYFGIQSPNPLLAPEGEQSEPSALAPQAPASAPAAPETQESIASQTFAAQDEVARTGSQNEGMSANFPADFTTDDP